MLTSLISGVSAINFLNDTTLASYSAKIFNTLNVNKVSNNMLVIPSSNAVPGYRFIYSVAVYDPSGNLITYGIDSFAWKYRINPTFATGAGASTYLNITAGAYLNASTIAVTIPNYSASTTYTLTYGYLDNAASV
jgi:hypothetical protein